MSLAGSIIGIPGLEVERVDRRDTIRIWAKPRFRPACPNCQNRHVRIKATHQRTIKHSRQGTRVMLLHLRVPKYHCLDCGRYFRHQFLGIRPRFRASESYRLEVFEAHDGGVTQRKLSLTHRISAATVERWYQYYIRRRQSELSQSVCPRVLGIDEHFFTRKKGFATTLVDLRNHKVFDVRLGRSEASLGPYLSRLKGRDKVQVVVMDLSETYRSIVRRYFPKAQIVADRFHVVRLINQHYMKLWSQHDPEGRKNRALISLMRRHEWHLRDDQHANLMAYLSDYPILRLMYQVKQKLVRLMLLKTVTKKRAKRKLPELLLMLEHLKDSPLRTLGKTLKSWLQPIVAMWRFSKTNGITEGFHTKMEMMTRRAYGFRNFGNYRLRVLAQCGWNGMLVRH